MNRDHLWSMPTIDRDPFCLRCGLSSMADCTPENRYCLTRSQTSATLTAEGRGVGGLGQSEALDPGGKGEAQSENAEGHQ
jgi:hypothetical protein